MQGIIGAAKGFAGYMGANVIWPDPARLEYVIIFRFDSYGGLERWQRSEGRRGWIEKSCAVTEGEPLMQVQAGLDFWFTPRAGSRAVAPRYKTVLIVIPVISILLLTLVPFIQQATEGLPTILRTVAGVVVMVLLMTYVIMPALTRVIAPWLYNNNSSKRPKSEQTQDPSGAQGGAWLRFPRRPCKARSLLSLRMTGTVSPSCR